MQEQPLGHPHFLSLPSLSRSWAGHLLCTAGEVALQGVASVWAAEGLGEGRVESGVTGKGLESSAGKGQTQPAWEVSDRSSTERVLRLNSS